MALPSPTKPSLTCEALNGSFLVAYFDGNWRCIHSLLGALVVEALGVVVISAGGVEEAREREGERERGI